jgi:hypothetical protein
MKPLLGSVKYSKAVSEETQKYWKKRNKMPMFASTGHHTYTRHTLHSQILYVASDVIQRCISHNQLTRGSISPEAEGERTRARLSFFIRQPQHRKDSHTDDYFARKVLSILIVLYSVSQIQRPKLQSGVNPIATLGT